MATGLPGIVINKVPVGIHAITWHTGCRSNLRKSRHGDCRQPTFIGSNPGVQPNTSGIEALVFGEKSFDETVPAQAGFVHLIGVHYLYVGKRYQLHTSRRHRIEPW